MDNSHYEQYRVDTGNSADGLSSSRLNAWAGELKAKLGLRRLPPAALAVLAVLLLGLVAFGLWRFTLPSLGDGDAGAAREPVITTGDGSASDRLDEAKSTNEAGERVQTSESSAPVTVYVVGAVKHPGVYELMSGARGIDAVEAAGGLSNAAASEAVNLAAILKDGAQLTILTKKQAKKLGVGTNVDAGTAAGTTAAGIGGVANGAASTLVDLNHADSTALQTLPGIGPATAEKIIAEREKNGSFASLDDLMRVSGIGEKRVEALRGLAQAGK